MRVHLNPAKSLDHRALSRGSKNARFSSTAAQSSAQPNQRPTNVRTNDRVRQAAADRDLVLDVLSSTATKRDARQYISRFTPPKPSNIQPNNQLQDHSHRSTGVNLGALFQAPRSVDTTPQFRQYPRKDDASDPAPTSLHTAVMVIRSTSSVTDMVLEGVGHTLAQLSRLGLNCIVIVDDDVTKTDRQTTQALLGQVDRVVTAIEKDETVRARRLDGLFYHSGPKDPNAVGVELLKPAHLHEAFQREFVSVTAPLIYDDEEKLIGINASGAALALARSSRGGRLIKRQPETRSEAYAAQQQLSLDRIIILDPRGGIPQVSLGGSHVFVNLEQEFSDVYQDLNNLREKTGNEAVLPAHNDIERAKRPSVVAAANRLTDDEIRGHISNLQLARGTLGMLPSTSSALITTPQAAAYSAGASRTSSPSPGVGTRSQKNPLIHNLLTDKPLFSSSLPRQRLAAGDNTTTPTNHPSLHHAPPTHLKHGMPVVVLPDPIARPWLPPTGVTCSMSLDDSRIDIPRLVHLIEDSFGRPLDQEHYFSRIRPILAGVIIAGDYEGGAILTWEQPGSATLNPNNSPRAPPLPQIPTPTPENPHRLVPYLDKFAVLKRSQGAGGVADVVFSAMVRRCFPDGVCWRSRRGNPVNKWYFERSRGTYKLPLTEPGGQGWTMFWTTEDLRPERFSEYAEVCAAIPGSWADGKKILD